MLFSEVIGPAFFNIGLTKENRRQVDAHFAGAAHHQCRMDECERGTQDFRFHEIRLMAHLRYLLATVYRHGDFRYAKDESLRGMEDRENWHPDRFVWPDPNLFDAASPDPRFDPGFPHPLDGLLKSLDPAIPAPGLTNDGYFKIRGNAGSS